MVDLNKPGDDAIKQAVEQNQATAVESKVAPEIVFDVEGRDWNSSPREFRLLMTRLHDLRLVPGSVLKRYSQQIEIIAPQELKKTSVRCFLCQKSGFDELGLDCFYENGVLTIEGFDYNDKKPTLPYDGQLKIIVNAKIDGKIPAQSLVSVPVVKTCPEMFRCAIDAKNIKLVPKEFIINPDPKTLWKDLPVDENAPFPKENSCVGSWEIVASDKKLVALGASRRGRSHANEGKHRDDHFLFQPGETGDDWQFFAVADGAGSAKFSREGSRIACETMVANLKSLFSEYGDKLRELIAAEIVAKSDLDANPVCDPEALKRTHLDQFFHKAAYAVFQEILAAANKENAKINDFNTTLLCAAIKRFPGLNGAPPVWAIASYWIGDGGAVLYRPNGLAGAIALGTPDAGEFAGQTRFITMRDEINEDKVAARTKLNFVKDFQALVLTSDGVTDPYFPSENDLTDYGHWQTFWNETIPTEFNGILDASKPPEERANALLKGLDFFVKGNHDDRTILIAISDDCVLDDAPFNPDDLEPDDLDSGSLNIEAPSSTDSASQPDDNSLNIEAPSSSNSASPSDDDALPDELEQPSFKMGDKK